MTNKIKLLDCSLRDGGYYTQWDYDPQMLSSYFSAIDESGIDYCEIGLRTPPKDKYLGALAYSPESFLETLNLPKKCKIAVMINASDFATDSAASAKLAILPYFQKTSKSKIQLVRIASHVSEIDSALNLVTPLKELGYQVGLNLMQVGSKTSDQLEQAVSVISQHNSVDVLYFADSLGNMGREDIARVLSLFRKEWRGDIGIHCHNNCGRALDNTLYAREIGVTWLDSTITGIGRGAGNTPTEYLLMELQELVTKDLNPKALYPIIIEYFASMKQKYGWGENLFYFLAAKYKIHPTYIQELMSSEVYESRQILKIIEGLKNENASQFQQKLITKALNAVASTGDGSWDAKSWCKNKPVLILANGPSLKNHAAAVHRFIKTIDPIVLSLNINKFIDLKYINYLAACTDSRLLLEYTNYKTLNKPIFLPLAETPQYIKEELKAVTIFDYGKMVSEGQFAPSLNKCIIPYSLVAAYGLSLAIIGEAREVFLAGFDGYKPGTSKQNEMENLFNLIKNRNVDCKITSITDTNYPVDKRSVYSFEF